jgi:hypothetical protein
MQNYLSTFLNYVSGLTDGSGSGATPPINQAPAQQSIVQLMQQQGQMPATPNPKQIQWRASPTTGKPIADLPDPDEVALDVYPTIHSLQPTKLNEGKPWAGQKIPTGYLDGLAYAEHKAREVGGLDEDTLKQFLPLATRESRYHKGTAYGNNGVLVNYKTPPPKDLQGIINESTTYAKLANKAFDSGNMGVFNEFDKKRAALEAQLLADPRWKSRADSYHKVTKYATDLGLKQSTNQEIIRDPKTQDFIGKADRYIADDEAPYATKALHVPLALYNKRYGENRKGSGLDLTKKFIGGGKDAVARSKHEAEITEAIYHPKNKPVLDYYTQRVQHHSTKGKK